MNIVVVCDPGRPHLGGNLNVRELLNPLFYTPTTHHPDRKRQRGARLRARALKQARELKARDIPLREVDPTVYVEWMDWDDHRRWTRTQIIRQHVMHEDGTCKPRLALAEEAQHDVRLSW
jgi:hypothetical protein